MTETYAELATAVAGVAVDADAVTVEVGTRQDQSAVLKKVDQG
jgi:hypothetical protein